MEQIGNLVSREALMPSTKHSDTMTEMSPKEMLGEDYHDFRTLMRRISSEYNWQMTKEDGLTWASLAAKLGFKVWAKAVLAYLTDTSEDADGKPKCTFRPKVGEIMAHAEKIKRDRKMYQQSRKTSDMMRGEKASDEVVQQCMAEIRSQSWYSKRRAK